MYQINEEKLWITGGKNEENEEKEKFFVFTIRSKIKRFNLF